MAAENEKKAAADRDLAVKQAEYKKEINATEATAVVAFDIEKARQGQQVRTFGSGFSSMFGSVRLRSALLSSFCLVNPLKARPRFGMISPAG